MIFLYKSCPLCGCKDIYKDSKGFEQCHDCSNPYTYTDIPQAKFLPLDEGTEQVIRGIN